MNNLWFIGWTTAFLYLFLETDAVAHWGNLLGFKFLRYHQYKEKQKLFPVKYRDFFRTQYPNFFSELITCQECLGSWMTIAAFAFKSKYLGGLQAFGWTLIGVLVGIALIKFILRKLYE